ncbi:hypothetical protein VCHC17A1_2594B, partial [Vibrio cholerae HC-17A1]
PCKPYFQPIT